MPAQLRPVASEILRRIMELSCAAYGKILKFHLSAGGDVIMAHLSHRRAF